MFDVSKMLSIGQNAMKSRVVQRSDTAAAYSGRLQQFLATPILIDMGVRASMDVIDQCLPPDMMSVGRYINFEHTVATSIGMTVTVKATIISMTEKEVEFRLEAWDEQGDIAHGIHRRCIVHRDDMEKRVSERRSKAEQRAEKRAGERVQ